MNSGNRTQVLVDLQFVSTKLQTIDSASTSKDSLKMKIIARNDSSLLEEIMSLKMLLSEKSNARTINIHSLQVLFDKNVYFSVRNRDIKRYSENVMTYAASPSRELHPVSGVGLGDVYKMIDESSTVWVGQMPVLIPLLSGENRFRIYFGLTHYDFTLHATKEDVTIQSLNYGVRRSCASFAEGVEDIIKKEINALSDSKVRYSNKTAKISIPFLQGAHDPCVYKLNFGMKKYYRINLSSTPKGAKVYVDGKEYGETPIELLIRRYFKRFRVAFKKRGYYNAEHEYQADENNLNFSATLKPINNNGQKVAP